MKLSEFRKSGKVTIAGKRAELYEGKNIMWYRFQGRNVCARTREEAIEKLKERYETEH